MCEGGVGVCVCVRVGLGGLCVRVGWGVFCVGGGLGEGMCGECTLF